MKTLFSHLALSLAFVVSMLLTSVAAQQSFEITSLSASGASIIEHNVITGDDRGGIALSQSNIFYTGDSSTGAFSVSNLSNAFSVGYQYDALASDLRTKQVYTLGTQFGVVGRGGDLVTRLIPLDGATGQQISGDIQLSMPIALGDSITLAGIFSGWNRIVLLDGDSMDGYNIDLPSGIVTYLGPLNLYAGTIEDNRTRCENWATWGVAEYSGGTIKLVYASSFVGLGSIKRYDVTSGSITTVGDFPSGIADMCSITVDPAANRWYFHYETYSGAFGFGSDESIGYADATFLAPSSSTATLSGRVLLGKGRGISGAFVTATGSDGKVYNTVTNTYGYYGFPKLPVGRAYVVSVQARRHYFPVSSEVVVLNEDLIGLDFEALR